MTDGTASAANTGPMRKAKQSGDQREKTAPEAAPPSPRFGWARNPEFWIILFIAAFLRLWHLDHSQWLDDQAQLLTLARDAWTRGALPITGIRSSIGTLNPPLSVYILMPFFLFTRSPLPALIGLALWNIFGVALCYLFALRFFSRRAAFCAALLFACCGAAVNYSRFIWQQNYLPPLLLLWAFTLYLGVVRERRTWLALHLLLLVAIISLHPTGLTLLAVTVVALVIAPRWPARRDTLLGLGLALLLLLPTLLWEALSGFSDLQLLRQFTGQRSVIDLDVFHALSHLLGAPAYPDPGRNTPYPALLDSALYARIGGLNTLIDGAVAALYIACYLVLTALALAPIRRVRENGATDVADARGWWRGWRWLVALRRALQADARWRSYLLLWVWLTIPPLTMLRHSKIVQTHYLFILYPAFFLSVGVAVEALIRVAPRLAGILSRWPRPRVTVPGAQRVLAGVVVASVLLVALGQATQTTLFVAALGGNQVSTVNFGYPLNQLLAADGALGSLERGQGAHRTVVSMPSQYTAQAMTSTLIREDPDRIGVAGDCLVLPGPQTGDALEVSTRAASPQARLLATLPNARLVERYLMPGDEPLMIYRLAGRTPLLADERILPSAIWQDGSGDALRLVAAARIAPGVVRLRWVVEDAATNQANAAPQFEMRTQTTAADGATTTVARATCQPTGLRRGDTIFIWVSTAWSANGTSFTAAAPPLPDGPLTLVTLYGTQALWKRDFGPMRLLSAAPDGEPLTPMALMGSSAAYQLPRDLIQPAAP
jgi:4-amino-4-deoxy-L-arabinose transferase-like glycosyltransferase